MKRIVVTGYVAITQKGNIRAGAAFSREHPEAPGGRFPVVALQPDRFGKGIRIRRVRVTVEPCE